MFQYLVFVCLFMLSSISCGHLTDNELPDDQELVFAIVIHRHGERAPDNDELSLYDQPELVLNLTYLEGPEGLTNIGKRRSYQIGKFLRQRYGAQGYGLLSNLYLQNEIRLRSTDKERTKMTAQIAMAALYPPEPEQQWDEGLGKIWQPVPYTAVPLSEDYLRYYSNCEHFKTLMAQAKIDALQNEFQPYMDLIPLLYQKTGKNFTEDPLRFETLFDLFNSLSGLGLDLPQWSFPISHRLGEAARLAYRLYFRTDEMKKIGGGVLLNDFIQAANDIMSGKQVTQRVRVYSSHDFNIGALMEVANVKNNQTIPEYRAVFALELYRSRSTGTYGVLPVYVPQAGQYSAQELRIKDCGSCRHCEISKFKDLTKDFLLPEREFYQICNIRTEL